MSATQDRPSNRSTRRTPLIDGSGNHMQMHGDPAQHCNPSTMRRLGVPPALQVFTRAEPRRRKGQPEVVLYTADAPFIFDWRMTAEEARALATNLLHAADTADQVAEANAKRATRKAST